jgi:glycine cleavage system H protein
MWIGKQTIKGGNSMNVPENLRYTSEHEWIRVEGKRAVVGITDYAQQSLGDIVFVELPEVGDALKAGAPFGVVESVKAVSDLYAPLTGTVVERNDALLDEPELINSDAYQSYMIVIDIADEAEVNALIDAAAYTALFEQER